MSGLGRAWARKNVETAKGLLAELTGLTPDERDYLNEVIREGELFLQLTSENRAGTGKNKL